MRLNLLIFTVTVLTFILISETWGAVKKCNPTTQFQCSDGSCIKLKLKCDGDPDCPDESDEDAALCAPPAEPEPEPVVEPEPAVEPAPEPEPERESAEEDEPVSEFPLGARTADDEEVIAEAERLIEAGSTHIDNDEQYRNVILLVGNSGAGKSTLGKILTVTDDTELTSIPAGDRFIIRDKEGRISSRTATVISKSIFPKLLINSVNGDAFYDLPGFGDTRGPAVELGNADFMKRVGDRASKFKILIIVNYSSLKSGEIRTDFRNLLDSLHEYFPNLNQPKFKPGIALVANKVDPDVKTEAIIPAIARFLKNAQDSLPIIYAGDAAKLETSKALIDILLTKDKKGTGYARLGFFKTPDREGPLSGIPSVQAARTVLSRILSSNTLFVTKSSTDFGLSMSPNTRYFLAEASKNIQRSGAQVLEEISGHLRKYFDEKAARDLNLVNLLSFKTDLEILREQTEAFVQAGNGSSVNSEWSETIPATLTKFSEDLQLPSELESEVLEGVEKMGKYLKNLAFLDPFLWGVRKQRPTQKQKDDVGSRDIEGAVKWWSSPLSTLVRDIQTTFYILCQNLDQDITKTYLDVSRGIQEVYRDRLQELYEMLEEDPSDPDDNIATYKQILEDDEAKVKDLIGQLEEMTTTSNLASFANETFQTFMNLGVEFETGLLEELEKLGDEEGQSFSLADWDDRPSPFTPTVWIQNLDKLKNFLNNEILELGNYKQEKAYADAKGALEENEAEGADVGLEDFEILKTSTQEQVDAAAEALLSVRAEMDKLIDQEREILEPTLSELEENNDI